MSRLALARELCKSIQRDDYSLSQLLVSQGASPNTPLPDGVSPFHIAVGADSVEYVKLMLQYNGNPNVRSCEGLTPLQVAAMWGKYDALQLLLYNGGDPFIRDEDGNNAYKLAEEYGDKDCIDLLMEYKEWDTDIDSQESLTPRYSLLPVSSYNSQESPESDSRLLRNLTWDTHPPPNTLSSNHNSPMMLEYSYSPTNQRPPSSCSMDSTTSHRPPSSCSMDSATNQRPLSSCSLGTVSTNASSFTNQWSDYADIDEEIAFNFTKRLSLLSSSLTKRFSNGTQGSDFTDSELDLGMCNSQQSSDGNLNISTATYIVGRGSPRPGVPRLSSDLSDRSSIGHVSMDSRDNGLQRRYSDMGYKITSELDHCNSDHEIDFDLGNISDNSLKDIVDNPSNELSHSNDENLEIHSLCESGSTSCANENNGSNLHDSSSHSLNQEIGDTGMNMSVGMYARTLSGDFSQGLDVTSPDHPCLYVKSSTSSSEDDDSRLLDKTVLFCGSITEEEDEDEAFEDDEVQMKNVVTVESVASCGDDVTVSSKFNNSDSSKSEEFYSAAEELSTEHKVHQLDDTLILSDGESLDRFCLDADMDRDSQTVQSCRFSHKTACPDTLVLDENQSESLTCSQNKPQNHVLIENPSCPDTLILDDNQSESLTGTENKQQNHIHTENTGCQDTLILEENQTQSSNLQESQHFVKDTGVNTLPDTFLLDNSDETLNICHDRKPPLHRYSTRLATSKRRKRYSNLHHVSDFLTSDNTSTESLSENNDRFAELTVPVRSESNPSSDTQTPDSYDSSQTVEYIYTDTDVGAALIERRCPSSSCNSSVSGGSANSSLNHSTGSDETIIYDWKQCQTDDSACEDADTESVPDVVNTMSNKEIQSELNSLGESPGPVTNTTRKVYLDRLNKLKKDPSIPKLTTDADDAKSGFTYELHQYLCQNLTLDMQEEEMKIAAQFDQPDPQRKWREGTLKSSFNYLLLDPRVTRNLPVRHHHGMNDMDAFKVFVSAIFYVGKGKRARPYAHFYEGLEQIHNPRLRPSKKVQHILDIWNLDLGVVSLHCFQSVIPVEAYTREACMVETLGLSRLTNAKKGDYYGIAATWTASKKRKMGVHILNKAFKIFLVEGERQIRPADIRKQ